MAQYFESILVPRIKKVIFSENWLDGKPQNKNGAPEQILKYHSLEQYEDTLLNIEFIEPRSNVKDSKDYKLRYMLDYETRDSNVFLNLDLLENPHDYKLKIEENGKIREVGVDLVETFNYIAGIHVNSIYLKIDGNIKYIFVKGRRDERSVLVVWRNKPESFNPEQDKEFVEQEIANDVYDEVLVNGNSLIRGAKSIDVIFKEEMFRWD
jgi:adenine-specific DNA-methyltransferase